MERARNYILSLGRPRTGAQRAVVEQARTRFVTLLRRYGFSEASIRARLGWITKQLGKRNENLAKEHERILGRQIHGLDGRRAWLTLQQHVTERSSALVEYLDIASDLGYSEDEAIDQWFSPEAA